MNFGKKMELVYIQWGLKQDGAYKNTELVCKKMELVKRRSL
jgi:hypothetical protein